MAKSKYEIYFLNDTQKKNFSDKYASYFPDDRFNHILNVENHEYAEIVKSFSDMDLITEDKMLRQFIDLIMEEYGVEYCRSYHKIIGALQLEIDSRKNEYLTKETNYFYF